MTISIIIPVYKVELYIRRCLQSVIDQKIDCYNLECLIIDDCSPDHSMDIVEDVIKSYQGSTIAFKIIRHDVNKGLSVARNTGILASTGDYLFFIDSDDYILNETFYTLVKYIHKYPNADIIMGNSFDVEKNSLSNILVMNNNPCFINNQRTILYQMLRRCIDRHAWNKLIRRSLIVENNLFFDDGLLYEDVTWSYRLYSTVLSVLILPELTYMYEYNPSSIVHSQSERSQKMAWSFVFIVNYLLNNQPIIDGKKTLFTEHSLFVHHWMLIAVDFCEKYGSDVQTRINLIVLKRKLFWKSVCHFRPIMTLYFLTMFKPFIWLMKVRAYRANLYRLCRVVYKLS